MRLSLSLAALLLPACVPLAAQEASAPVLPAFDPTAFGTPAENPWFPLRPALARTFAGETADDETERFVLTVQGRGPEILGVPTVAVLDEA